MAKIQPPAPPPEIAHIVGCIGEENALWLIETRGGTMVYVPKPAYVGTSWMMEHLGEVALMRLAGALGGSRINVPLCREWRARLYLFRGGRSHAEIALKVGGTVNWVQSLARTDWVPMPRTHRGLPRDNGAVKQQMSFFDLP